MQDGEKIDYEKLRKAGAGILGGKYEYSRLYNNEEEGRNGAGRVAVEATLLAENHKRNNPEKYSTSPKTWSGHKKNVGDLEQQLESYAKKYGYWYEPGSFDSDPEYNYVGGGSESKVFIDKYDDDYLVKENGYDHVSMVDPLTFLDERIAIHNRNNPPSKYEVLGFTRDAKGNFNFVLRPKYIHGENATPEQIDDFMLRDYKAKPLLSGRNSYVNDEYIYEDYRDANIINDGNELVVIDSIIKPRRTDIKTHDASVSKAIDENGEPLASEIEKFQDSTSATKFQKAFDLVSYEILKGLKLEDKRGRLLNEKEANALQNEIEKNYNKPGEIKFGLANNDIR